MELLVPFITFLCGFQPFSELFGEPKGMICLVQDVQNKGRGTGALAAGKVIVCPCPHFHRLWCDSIARRAKSGADLHVPFFVFAGGGNFFASNTGLAVFFHFRPDPFEADSSDAEIVANVHIEGDDF